MINTFLKKYLPEKRASRSGAPFSTGVDARCVWHMCLAVRARLHSGFRKALKQVATILLYIAEVNTAPVLNMKK